MFCGNIMEIYSFLLITMVQVVLTVLYFDNT